MICTLSKMDRYAKSDVRSSLRRFFVIEVLNVSALVLIFFLGGEVVFGLLFTLRSWMYSVCWLTYISTSWSWLSGFGVTSNFRQHYFKLLRQSRGMISPSVLFVSHRTPPNSASRKHLQYVDMEVSKPGEPINASATDTVLEDQTFSISSCLNCVRSGRGFNWRGRTSLKTPPVDETEEDESGSHLQHRNTSLLMWPLFTVFVLTLLMVILYLGSATFAAQTFMQHLHCGDIGHWAGRAHNNVVEYNRPQLTKLSGSDRKLAPILQEPDGSMRVFRRKALNMLKLGGRREQTHVQKQNLRTIQQDINVSANILRLGKHLGRTSKMQDEVYHNLPQFLKSYELMEKTFRIYVYKDGYRPLVHYAKESGIYATEGLFLKRLREGNRVTVTDPSKASMYFLPFSVRQMVDHLQDPHARSMRTLKTYIANYVEKIAGRYPFWNRTHGADHFFVSCHDWASYATGNHEELRINAMKVVCNTDVSTAGFDVNKDVSLPQALIGGNQSDLEIGNLGPDQRDFLAFYAGQMHGLVRPMLLKYWKDKDPSMKIYEVLPPSVVDNISYVQHMKRSKFCLCPKGFEVNSPRIVESILNECVPVIISDNFVLPFSDVLDWTKFSIIIPEKEIPNLKKILSSVPDATYRAMQNRLKYVRRHFVWLDSPHDTRYDSFHMILYSIWLQSLRIHERLPAAAAKLPP